MIATAQQVQTFSAISLASLQTVNTSYSLRFDRFNVPFHFLLDAEAYGLAKYGEGGGFVGISDVLCIGTESNITQCQYTVGSTCSHSMDAGIKCQPISPCEQIGHLECCTSGCFNAPFGCWCDAACHFFNDCCDLIESTCPCK